MIPDVPANLSHLTIRSATNDDRQRVAKLVFGVLAEFGLEPNPETTDADLKDLEANYIKRGGLFEVIEDGQANLLGSFGLYPINKTTCELRNGMVLTQSFNGAGDTWTPTIINLFVFWLWELPLAYVLAIVFGIGPRGVFLAIMIAFSTLAIVSALVFRRGKWKGHAV